MTLRGVEVRVADGVLVRDRGRVLVGGSPLTMLRLSATAAERLGPGGFTVTDRTGELLAGRLLAANMANPVLDDVPTSAIDEITVVIPTRDRPEQLDRALSALRPLRCLVVDDASFEPGRVAAVADRHRAELVTLRSNVGPAGARNAGLARVSTPLVAFVDSDVQVSADSLLALSRHFIDHEVTLVAPRITGAVHGDRPRWFERYDANRSSLDLGERPGVVRPGAAVAWLPSACMLARRAALGRGFDAALRVGEDVDLVWRLAASGHRIRYDPSVRATHDVRTTLRSWLGRKAYYGSGGAELAIRHPGALAPAVISPVFAAAALALLSRTRWSVPLAGAALALGTRGLHRSLPEMASRAEITVRLATRGLGWAVRQEAQLGTRHWWPATLTAAVFSARARRVAVSALVVDTVIAVARQRNDPVGLPATVLGHRLDDLAYGAGLWWGAWRARSLDALRPRRPARPRKQ